MDYKGLDQAYSSQAEILDKQKQQEALTQAQLEREGQHKLWLDMPQTKILLLDLEAAINNLDLRLDLASTTTQERIRELLAFRRSLKLVLLVSKNLTSQSLTQIFN